MTRRTVLGGVAQPSKADVDESLVRAEAGVTGKWEWAVPSGRRLLVGRPG